MVRTSSLKKKWTEVFDLWGKEFTEEVIDSCAQNTARCLAIGNSPFPLKSDPQVTLGAQASVLNLPQLEPPMFGKLTGPPFKEVIGCTHQLTIQRMVCVFLRL